MVKFTVYPVPECGNKVCEQPPGKTEAVKSCPQDCDTAAPETSISSKPSSPTAVTSAKIAFECKSPNNTACTFQCSVDSATFEVCTSPHSVTGLVEGQHTFRVRAKHPAGIADETPSEASWTVDTTGPTFGGLTRAKKQSDGTSVLLEWAAATDNVSTTNTLLYQICRSETKGWCKANFSATHTTLAGATSYAVFSLLPTSTYYFAARAADQAGNASAISEEREVKMAGGKISTVAGPPTSDTSGSYYS